MGSFNLTCGISNAPIRSGDKVRLFLLCGKTFSGRNPDLKRDMIYKGESANHYINFDVIGGISIKAIYDDYNNYQLNDKSIFPEHILNTIKKYYLMNSAQDKESDRDKKYSNISSENLTWDKIFKMIHYGYLHLDIRSHRKGFVNTMVVHESVYQACLKTKIELYENQDKQSSYKDFVKFCTAQRKANPTSYRYPFVEHDFDNSNLNQYAFLSKSNLKLLEDLSKEKDFSVTMHDIEKRYYESLFFTMVLEEQGYEYNPSMTTNQESSSLSEHQNFWDKISFSLNTLNEKRSIKDFLPTKSFMYSWQSIKLSELKEFIDGYGDAEDRLKSLNKLLSSYSVGDEIKIKASDFEKAKYEFIHYSLLNNTKDLIIQYDN